MNWSLDFEVDGLWLIRDDEELVANLRIEIPPQLYAWLRNHLLRTVKPTGAEKA